MDAKSLKKTLKLHKMWLDDNPNGKCANLIDADLSHADLSHAILTNADLSYADLSHAILTNADLRGTNLRGTNLTGADLSYANLTSANLRGANLTGAILTNTNLRNADLHSTNLRYADLSYANLTNANLRCANLTNIKTNYQTIGIKLACSETGAFEAWKKCNNNVLVKLLIPEDAKRSSATTSNCRASHVKVLEVIGAKKGITTYSDIVTEYVEGQIVKANSWDENRWNECSNGIHFFVNRCDAESWGNK